MTGLFIVFEGIDGCGKSTQLELAAVRLVAGGRKVVTTREPGGTAIAETIRALILSPEYAEMVPECELLLYAAARAQHVREKILPALDAGAIVLCDRFDLATYAYQGFGRNIPLTLLKSINEAATGGLAPRCTFLFDISVDAAFKRLAAMGKARDRLESDDRDFFSRVAEGYRVLARQANDKVVILDAEKPIEELAGIVYRKIVGLLE
jgi:dTMP kinase